MRFAADSAVQINHWIREELEKLRQQKGWSEIPMDDPHFNFYDYTKAVMLKLGFRGMTAEEKASETIVRLFLDVEEAYHEVDRTNPEDKVGEGPLLRRYDGRIAFDTYFKMAVKRRGKSESRDRSVARENLPTVNITPGGKEEGDTSGGISEEMLGGGESDIMEGRAGDPATHDYMQQTFRNLLRYLRLQRHGDMLTLIFRLMTPTPLGQGMTQQDVVEYLNDEHIVSPSGEDRWSPGMLNSYVQKLRRAVEVYISEEDKGEGGEGTLKGIMKQRKPVKVPLTPGQAPVAPKPVGQVVWFRGGNPEDAVKVKLIRRSAKNSRIELPDGSQQVVPTEHISVKG